MKITVLGKKIAGIIMAAIMTMSIAAISASAEGGSGDIVTEPNTIARQADAEKWELIDPASITDANATAGGNIKLVVTFTEAFAEGYEIQINFTTASGITKTFTASTQKPPMKTNFSCIPIRDIYEKLGLGGETLSSVTFTGRSAGQITRIEYAAGSYSPTPAAANTSAPAASNASADPDKNPATGVADLTLPLILVGVCGAAVIITAKSRKTK